MRACYGWNTFDPAHGWAQEETAEAAVLLGPEAVAALPFTDVVPSWGAATPPGGWVEIQLRARLGGRWGGFYRIAQWDAHAAGSRRRSFGPQRDADGHVATDTLVLSRPAEAVQARVLLYGGAALEHLALALSGPGSADPAPTRLPAIELAVPPRAQLDYPDGPNICSPTSLSMLLAYWHARTGDARLAPFAERRAVAELATPLVYDPAYDGHGNWGFNTALAASYGLRAYVARLGGLAELAAWVAAGVPVIVSAAWEPGLLDGAPIERSRGHLLVVAGFTADRRVIVADPRGNSEAEVRRLYDAAQLTHAWQDHTAGTVYLIYPPSWPVPTESF